MCKPPNSPQRVLRIPRFVQHALDDDPIRSDVVEDAVAAMGERADRRAEFGMEDADFRIFGEQSEAVVEACDLSLGPRPTEHFGAIVDDADEIGVSELADFNRQHGLHAWPVLRRRCPSTTGR